ncbi:MAG: hypothetical protein O6944_00165 [Gammaproteobacteria bacterium]|nr:hypothetical protein [Gammaproteobacteria bacterium]
MPGLGANEVSPGATVQFNRVFGPEAEALSCGDKKVPKETPPDDWVPSGLPCVLQAARGASTAPPYADAARAHPLRAPSGSLLAAFQYSAASNG